MTELPISFSGPVADALSEARPVVALESTIITHGLPYPQNLETATEVEEVVRRQGAVPATIAVLNGTLNVGLTGQQLQVLATARDVRKLSRADIALALAQRATGSTTVAATMIAARAAGIDVFATGGIGGVHRGAERSFDVSADLQELAQTPVTVVAAGAKAILDLPKTLEVLETLGAAVIGYRTRELPAFWSRTSGLELVQSAETAAEIAQAHVLRGEMRIPGGQLVANPIPQEDEIAAPEMRGHIEAALAEAEAAGITGKAVTPYLLDRIFHLTDGRSLKANVALIRNNAALAAKIAVELAALR